VICIQEFGALFQQLGNGLEVRDCSHMMITQISHFLSKFQLANLGGRGGCTQSFKQKVDFKFGDKMPAAGGKFQKFYCFWQILSTFQQSDTKFGYLFEELKCWRGWPQIIGGGIYPPESAPLCPSQERKFWGTSLAHWYVEHFPAIGQWLKPNFKMFTFKLLGNCMFGQWLSWEVY